MNFIRRWRSKGLDKNNDGIYDRKELAELAQVNMDGMQGFGYFTFVKLGAEKLELSPPVDYWLEYTNKILTLHFTLPLAHPVLAEAKDFHFSTYDESFFIAFSLAPKDAIALGGDVPAGCTATIGHDAGDALRLGQAFAQQFGSSGFGGNLGQSVAIACPDQ